MTLKVENDLSYGRLGEATYDEQRGSWRFQRNPGITRHIVPISEARIALSSTQLAVQTQQGRLAAQRTSAFRDLTGAHPSLAQAAEILLPAEQISDAVTAALAENDAICGDLLAFGKVYDWNRRYNVDIVAVAGGSAGHLLRLARVDRHSLRSVDGSARTQSRRGKVGVRGEVNSWTIKEAEAGWWTNAVDPIQQITFSKDNEGQPGPWLAVRRQRGVSIFKPCVQLQKVSSVAPDVQEMLGRPLPTSRVGPGWVLDLPIKQCGNFLFSDVSFNPWYQSQFVIIDIRGRWQIWEVQSRKYAGRGITTLAPGCTNEMQDSVRTKALDDGWCRTLWVGDSTTIMAMTRDFLSFWHVGYAPKRLESPDLGFMLKKDSYLDVRRCDRDPSLVWLLASSRLLCFRVEESKINVLFSVPHWHTEDFALRLSLLETETDVLAFLIGPSTEPITCFPFHRQNIQDDLLMCSDRFVFEPSQDTSSEASLSDDDEDIPQPALRRRFLVSRELEPVVDDDASFGETTDADPDKALRFVLWAYGDDLSISERIYAYGHPQSVGKTSEIVPVRSRRSSSVSVQSLEDDFIVDDAVDFDEHGDLHDAFERAVSALSRRDNRAEKRTNFRQHPVLVGIKEGTATSVGDDDVRDSSNGEGTLSTLLDKVQDDLEGYGNVSEGIETLMEHFELENQGTKVADLLPDIQDFTFQLREREVDTPEDSETSNEQTTARTKLKHLDNAQLIRSILGHGSSSNDLHQRHTYDMLLGLYMTPLSESLPGRSRLAVERPIRRLGQDLWLTLRGLRREPYKRAAPPAQRGEQDCYTALKSLGALTDNDSLPMLPDSVTEHWLFGVDPKFTTWDAIREAVLNSEPKVQVEASSKKPKSKGPMRAEAATSSSTQAGFTASSQKAAPLLDLPERLRPHPQSTQGSVHMTQMPASSQIVSSIAIRGTSQISQLGSQRKVKKRKAGF